MFGIVFMNNSFPQEQTKSALSWATTLEKAVTTSTVIYQYLVWKQRRAILHITRQALQSREIEEFTPKKSKMAVFGQNKGNPMD